jgi:hypothetical protein
MGDFNPSFSFGIAENDVKLQSPWDLTGECVLVMVMHAPLSCFFLAI